MRIRGHIEDHWEKGQKRFQNLYLDDNAGKALREYSWNKKRHDLFKREILGVLLGYDDVKESLRKDLTDTRIVLGLGTPTGRKGRTRIAYNQEQFLQLLVGFLSWHRAPNEESE